MKTTQELAKIFSRPGYKRCHMPIFLNCEPSPESDWGTRFNPHAQLLMGISNNDTWVKATKELVFEPGCYTLTFEQGAFMVDAHEGRGSNEGTGSALAVLAHDLGLENTKVRGTSGVEIMVVPKKEYHDLAVNCLMLMADPRLGAKLLDYTTEEGYTASLSMGAGSTAYDVAQNLLKHGGPLKSEIGTILQMCDACGNGDLAALLKEHVKKIEDELGRGNAGPGNTGPGDAGPNTRS